MSESSEIVLQIVEHLAPTLAAIGAILVSRRTHSVVNSRMSEMKRLIEDEAYARGRKDQSDEDEEEDEPT